MGSVFRKTTTRPVPASATIAGAGENRCARWKTRQGKTITKPVVTLDDGREVIRQESSTFFAKFRDSNNKVRTVPTGCKDEANARQVLANLEKAAERVKAGVMTPVESSAVAHANAPISNQVDDFLAGSLTGSDSHRKNTERYLRRLITDLRWTCLADMRRDDLERWLADQSRPGPDGLPIRSARSRDAFRTAAATFASWAERSGRLVSNPFSRMPKANLDADRRRPRRALTLDELSRLIVAAREAPERPPAAAGGRPAQRLSGADRSELYAFLASTGLRVNEARQLTVADLQLNASAPHVSLPGVVTKNRRAATLPLRSDVAESLRRRVHGRQASDRVFDIPADLIKRFHADCVRAGVPRYDQAKRQVDLHSLRLTFGSYLAVAGVPLVTAQKLMRHSDPKLTANVYTDPHLLDLAGAVESMPFVALSVAPTPAKSGASQSTRIKSSRSAGKS